jgi:hypothetical protein
VQVAVTEGAGVYEFVVAGSLGPVLRSMLADLEIEDRCGDIRLRLINVSDEQLLSLLAVLARADCELEHVLATNLSSPAERGRS